jgi:hypothetical protein
MGGGPKAPPPRDLEAEQREAEANATERANSEIAFRRRGRRRNSLIANPGGAGGTSAISSPYNETDTLG